MEPKDPSGENAQDRYDGLLNQLRQVAPRIADFLGRAQRNRARELNRYLNADALREHFPGTYLAGLEEIFSVLDAITHAYERSAKLKDIGFLVARVHDDFVSAIDAALSGFNGVVLDTMRDVMEVEYLLRDFSRDDTRIRGWLDADRTTLLKDFSPAALRRRQATAAGTVPENLPDAFEYRLHSEGLHVSPLFILDDLAGKGFSDVPASPSVEFAFAEMFEHARRMILAAYDLGATVEGAAWASPDVRTAMPEAAKAWERTQVVMEVIARFGRDTEARRST